jgi:sulfite exporter TauE/SafE
VVTIVTTSATYATLAAALLSGSLASGAVIGGVFGAARGLVVLSNRSAVDASRLRDVHRRFQQWDRPARRLVLSTQAVVVVALSGIVLAGGHP